MRSRVRSIAALSVLGVLAACVGGLLATESRGMPPDSAAADFFSKNPEARRWYDSLWALPESALPEMPGFTRARFREHIRRMLFAPESLYAGPDSAHASDSAMAARFRKHQPDFERLVRMFQEDSTLDRVADPEFRVFDAPRPPARRQAEYDRLFARLGVHAIRRNGDAGQGSIVLRVSTVWTFDRKGYVWSAGKVSPLVTTETTASGDFIVFKRIAPRWYIYFQSTS